ncbi:MAG: Cys-tRNA(Pro) deacylase [Pseudomonadales bacterium]|nr:Cys-tRNA(Pro) deacylase [Pseudomonadales bacterium]NRA18015.1 Cys-tRNA(Pro) deacylase [Oceanospirillaceae bacterium]
MTPAIKLAEKNSIEHRVHEYLHDPAAESYGAEAAEKMAVAEQQVFKTLVVSLDNRELLVAVLPVCAKLSMKLVAKAAGVKKALMADKDAVERATGYVLGGVSPLGQKKKLRTVVDASALEFATIYASAGRRGLEIELQPADLIQLTDAITANICQ